MFHMLPLSLYIHIPWCIQKCPYCDFNSHKSPSTLPEVAYVEALLQDLSEDLKQLPPRPIHTIFIGGGTPSLLSEHAYGLLFEGLHAHLDLSQVQEITLEANPNSIERERFKAYRALGINRLSIGVQSFNAKHLKKLGRVHNDLDAKKAIEMARAAGFDNINLDIMHGLPEQSTPEALLDIETALSYEPEHLSWYQLTLEPNTVFYSKPPRLPQESTCLEIERLGHAKLSDAGLIHYEISAFSRPNMQSKHNMNYWQFGDYYGIGAGAHSKWSDENLTHIYRLEKNRQPKAYLDTSKPFVATKKQVAQSERLFEYMLNATRLNQPLAFQALNRATGLNITPAHALFVEASQKGLLKLTKTHWQITDFGRQFTSDLQALFLP